MRLAFAYALNYTQVIEQAWFGEARQQASWWVDGLVPASSKNLTLTANMRNIDLAKMKYYLSQAIIDGHNISEGGFETTAIYNTGNDQRMIELQSIAAAFAAIGSQYKVNVMGLDWPIFLDEMYAYGMPVYCIGWLADYSDPSNWASPYQQSTGSFLFFQGPPWPGGDAHQAAVDAEIAAAAIETNPTLRDQMYQDLQYKYWLDLPSIPVVQPVGRRFARDWVKGWYYNDLYPGIYAYDLYKAAPLTYEDVDLDVSASITPVTTYAKVYVSYGKMLQLYGGGATATMTFSVHVNRTDSNNDVLLLAAEVGLKRTNLTSLATPASTYPSLQGPPWASPGGSTWFRDYRTGVEIDRFVPCQAPVYPTVVMVLLGPQDSATPTLTWYENGVSSALPGNMSWAISTLVGIGQTGLASDLDLNNNAIGIDPATYNCTALTTTTEVPHGSSTYDLYRVLVGDVNGDGIINILDAITLANSFGKNFGQVGFLKEADTDNNGTVNVLDAINLAGNFNKKVA
jgi:hypothetical protein